MKKLLAVALIAVMGFVFTACDDTTTTPTNPGNIVVTSVPAGAQIFLNGTNTGKVTPDTLKSVASGNQSITLKVSGFLDTTFTVSVPSGGTTSKAVTMRSSDARIVLVSTPAGAQIWLNGVNTGKVTPDTLKARTAGVKDTITLVGAENIADSTVIVTPVANSTVTQTITLGAAAQTLVTKSGIRLYEISATGFSGYNFSTGAAVSSTGATCDIYFETPSAGIKSGHLRTGTASNRVTDFNNAPTSTNINDGLDAPFYSKTTYNSSSKSQSSTAYSIFNDNTYNYGKIIITGKGGATGPSDPNYWVDITVIYNTTAKNRRF